MTKQIRQKVISVVEIGFEEVGHFDHYGIEFIDDEPHFVRFKYGKNRYIISTSIVEIGEFELPVTKMNYIEPKHWWQRRRVEVETVGRCSGSWVVLSDGRKIYVHETLEELTKMIEED